MTRNPLLNSRLFDPYRWSKHPNVIGACESLYSELGLNDKRLKPYVMMLLLDLYVSWRSDPSQYVSYSRNKNNYGKNSRYKRINVGYVGLTTVVVKLLENGLIEHVNGVCYRDAITKVIYAGYESKMKATSKLVRYIVKHKIKLNMISRHENERVIILRSEKVDDVSDEIVYDDLPRAIADSEKVLIDYNNLLAKTYIDLADDMITPDERDDYQGHSIDLSRKRVRRIFNNSSWSDGGRLYNVWWMECPKRLRKYIVIDGQPTVELDYSGFHIMLLYARVGINYLEHDDDPYVLDDHPHRSLNKRLMLIAINAKNDNAAVKATWEWRIGSGKRELYGIENHQGLHNILSALKTKHAPIARYIASGEGIKLQYQDSCITIELIKHFTKMKVPILTIHDSFITTVMNKPFLMDMMKVAYGNSMYNYLNQNYNSDIETINTITGEILVENTNNNMDLSKLISILPDQNDHNRILSEYKLTKLSVQVGRYSRFIRGKDTYQYSYKILV
jgi:hypothetical protein